ncbi:MAG: Asp-tRNA(Asn)/Glu-tRNA(Gln) amidotransferase subunit GatC [Chloroflexia bacterium]
MLTPEEVRHVAMLARLGLTDEEVDTMRAQLVQVLDYIAMLEKLDTSQVPPTAQILSHLNVGRPDVARPSWATERLLANAPSREGDFVRVPAVLEEFKGDKAEGVESEAGDA